MPYKNAFIYYWSGTGNSYRVSTWMGTIAEKKGLNSHVLSIDKPHPAEEIKGGSDTLMGFVFPTHGFTAPWHIIKCVWRLPKGNGAHAFCAATRAGLKFGPVFTPGISGSATFIIAVLLMLKGYTVRGSMSVDMPSNWYSFHPIQSRKSHETIINRGKHTVDRFMERIIPKNTVWLTVNNLYEVTWGILLSLISLVYLFMGRFFLAKLFFANKNCDGCGLCARYCSVGGIKMWGKKNPTPFWKYNCESCMRCAAFCPHNAIEAGHSWGVILYFITAVPVSAYLFSWVNDHISGAETIDVHWAFNLFDLIYYYPAIFISYYLFNALIRIPANHWLFTHTTLTHLSFWRRYREPDTKLKQIAVKNKGIGINHD